MERDNNETPGESRRIDALEIQKKDKDFWRKILLSGLLICSMSLILTIL